MTADLRVRSFFSVKRVRTEDIIGNVNRKMQTAIRRYTRWLVKEHLPDKQASCLVRAWTCDYKLYLEQI